MVMPYFQYVPDDNRNDYHVHHNQYPNNNYNNSGQNNGTRTLYHQGIVNTRDAASMGWKLQRNQAQLTSVTDSRLLQVRSTAVYSHEHIL